VELTRPRVLALVLAGGEGERLDVLTAERAKPAIPFAGVYRLIDFTLSNCRHSGIGDVWVLQQYEPGILTEHLANGRPWDLDRTHGGFRVLHPHLGRAESGWYRGNADALWRNIEDVRRFDPELVLVLSADHVYTLDYGEAIARHRAAEAGVTLVTTRVAQAQASRFGVVRVAGDGRVEEYVYKPEKPSSDVVATEVFVFDVRTLLESLEELAAAADEEDGLTDLGDQLLPRLAAEGRAVEHRLEGYWRDVGTVESYLDAHRELVADNSGLDLERPEWPILTWGTQRPPARISPNARIADALVSPGSRIEGAIVRSVLAPGVVVEAGAEVRDAVILHDATIRAGARIENAIVDEGVEIGSDATVGGSPGEATLVGRRARVARGARLAAGERIEPGSAA
jgi:glucose-1-phosphate adenylyltransferase